MTSRFELECIDCEFQSTVLGSFADAVEESTAHATEHEVSPDAHFVNVHRVERGGADPRR